MLDSGWKNIYNFSKKIPQQWNYPKVIQEYKQVKSSHL